MDVADDERDLELESFKLVDSLSSGGRHEDRTANGPLGICGCRGRVTDQRHRPARERALERSCACICGPSASICVLRCTTPEQGHGHPLLKSIIISSGGRPSFASSVCSNILLFLLSFA